MNHVRMILAVAAGVVVVALAAVIFVLTRGDDVSPPEPEVEAAQTETPFPKDELIVVVLKDTGQPAPPANETDGPKEDAIEEPPEEVEQPESPEEKAQRLEVERQSNEMATGILRALAMTPEQLEGVPDAVVEQFAAKMQLVVEVIRSVVPVVEELKAAREKAKREGVDDPRVEELKLQLRSKHAAMIMQVYSDLDEAIEVMRPYLNDEQRTNVDELHRGLEEKRQKFLGADF